MVDSSNGGDTFFQGGGTFREGGTVSSSRVYSMDVDVNGSPALWVQAPDSLGVKELIRGVLQLSTVSTPGGNKQGSHILPDVNYLQPDL